MSSFTAPMKIIAVRRQRRGLARLLPPGFFRPCYEVAERFEYAVGALHAPQAVIAVLEGFRFDGASIPLILRPLFPMAHPDYLQAACLHDWLYSHAGDWLDETPYATALGTHITRRFADDVFREALGVLGLPRHWRCAFWLAVRIGGGRAFVRKNESGIC